MIESYRKAQENPNVDAQKIIKYLQDDLGLARLTKKVNAIRFLPTIIPQGIKKNSK